MSDWHIITCEYPPDIGGVSDFTAVLASNLAAQGDTVHIWCGGQARTEPCAQGVMLHRELGSFSSSDLKRADSLLNDFSAPRRLLVQWVPHGYRMRAMNLGFCRWLARRKRTFGDRLDLMVHEAFLAFGISTLGNVIAFVHRLMTYTLLHAADRVWMSIPAWETRLRPYAPPGLQMEWLPIPSNVPVLPDQARAAEIRSRFPNAGTLIGHFGTYGDSIASLLTPVLREVLTAIPGTAILLLGKGSHDFAARFRSCHPENASRIYSSGVLSADDLSLHLQACDLMVQPYPDGISSRRTSAMACLAHGIAIATNTGCLSEDCWATSGLQLARSYDPALFRELLTLLMVSRDLRARNASAGAQLYRQLFDWPNAIAKLRDHRNSAPAVSLLVPALDSEAVHA